VSAYSSQPSSAWTAATRCAARHASARGVRANGVIVATTTTDMRIFLIRRRNSGLGRRRGSAPPGAGGRGRAGPGHAPGRRRARGRVEQNVQRATASRPTGSGRVLHAVGQQQDPASRAGTRDSSRAATPAGRPMFVIPSPDPQHCVEQPLRRDRDGQVGETAASDQKAITARSSRASSMPGRQPSPPGAYPSPRIGRYSTSSTTERGTDPLPHDDVVLVGQRC